MIEILNIVSIASAILAIVAAIYLFMIANKCEGKLQKGILLIAISTLTGLGIHSFFEFLEVYEFLTIEMLRIIMPILVLIGSISIIYGAKVLYAAISSVGPGNKNKKK